MITHDDKLTIPILLLRVFVFVFESVVDTGETIVITAAVAHTRTGYSCVDVVVGGGGGCFARGRHDDDKDRGGGHGTGI